MIQKLRMAKCLQSEVVAFYRFLPLQQPQLHLISSGRFSSPHQQALRHPYPLGYCTSHVGFLFPENQTIARCYHRRYKLPSCPHGKLIIPYIENKGITSSQEPRPVIIATLVPYRLRSGLPLHSNASSSPTRNKRSVRLAGELRHTARSK